MALAVSAAGVYLLLRPPVRFSRPSEREMRRVLDLHARLGGGTNPLMVAAGDKSAFVDGDRGFCLYRTVGPYVVVFSDPIVRSATERDAFLDTFLALATELDRRPVFYQISLDWIPVLHDRGHDFFKLGEEAQLDLSAITLDGHAGKMYRQIVRRAGRDGVRFRVLSPDEVLPKLGELEEISDDWLNTKGLAERQFSIGFFDRDYLSRYPCAIVEEVEAPHRIVAFANLLDAPGGGEASVDLMRHRSDGPKVMDFLFVSLFLRAKSLGFARFNLGMAPLASVGEHRGAHARERLARVLFQRGEQWYNFRGLRAYKDKFGPAWVPRYMAYQHAWEWPVVVANVSALIAGGWATILAPPPKWRPAVPHVPDGRVRPDSPNPVASGFGRT
jgi:phosphatidylglycerol lysyltransferase